jgi:hypothetical protein
LSAPDITALRALAARADAAPEAVAEVIAAARDLYLKADVFTRSAAIVRDQRARAAAAITACKLPRLREVLEFLLDLAVPEAAV